jgi:flagellar protein FliS
VGANWQAAYLEGKVVSASPVELVQMLYDAASNAIDDAIRCLGAGDIEGRSASVTKAMSILIELAGSLDREKGGEVAENLGRLYDYIYGRILDAHVNQVQEPLIEARSLVETLREAWQGVRQELQQAEEAAAVPVAPAASRFGWADPGTGQVALAGSWTL